MIAWGCTQPAPQAPAAQQTAQTKQTPQAVITAESLKLRKIETVPPNFPPPPGDDERPPIIISDGSIDFYVEAVQGKNAGRGKWFDYSGGKKEKWLHVPDGSPRNLTGLGVHLLHAEGSPDCMNPDHAFEVSSFQVITKVGGANVNIDVDGSAGVLTVVFPNLVNDDSPFWLVFDKPNAKLEAVQFPTGPPCTFINGRKHRGSITVFQR